MFDYDINTSLKEEFSFAMTYYKREKMFDYDVVTSLKEEIGFSMTNYKRGKLYYL